MIDERNGCGCKIASSPKNIVSSSALGTIDSGDVMFCPARGTVVVTLGNNFDRIVSQGRWNVSSD